MSRVILKETVMGITLEISHADMPLNPHPRGATVQNLVR